MLHRTCCTHGLRDRADVGDATPSTCGTMTCVTTKLMMRRVVSSQGSERQSRLLQLPVPACSALLQARLRSTALGRKQGMMGGFRGAVPACGSKLAMPQHAQHLEASMPAWKEHRTRTCGHLQVRCKFITLCSACGTSSMGPSAPAGSAWAGLTDERLICAWCPDDEWHASLVPVHHSQC